MRRRLRRLAILATLALGVLNTATSAQPDHDHAHLETEIVGITGNHLIPTVKIVPETAAFGWLNDSARDASIEFEDPIAAKLVCRSRGPFRLDGERMLAPRVASGSYATLCSLAAGEYDYRVRFADREAPLLGKIVVIESH